MKKTDTQFQTPTKQRKTMPRNSTMLTRLIRARIFAIPFRKFLRQHLYNSCFFV
jgi:hypothetical protein